MRINPEELHVSDSEFWDTLYGPGRVDKYDYFTNRLNIPRSIFSTADYNLHKLRKAPLLPLFSKKRISDFQPVIREKLDILCSKIDKYVAGGHPFAINRALTAFSGDVITTYVFGQSYQHLESPDFKETFQEPFMAASEVGHVALQFKWLYPLMQSLPEWLVLKMQPQILLVLQLAKVRTAYQCHKWAANQSPAGLRRQTQSHIIGHSEREPRTSHDPVRTSPQRLASPGEADRPSERRSPTPHRRWLDHLFVGHVRDHIPHHPVALLLRPASSRPDRCTPSQV